MTQSIKCIDCQTEMDINYDGCQGNRSNLDFLKSEVDENIYKRISTIEDMTNFNLKKNICLNCLNTLIEERERANSQIAAETSTLKEAYLNIVRDLESEEFQQLRELKEESLLEEERGLMATLGRLQAEEKQQEQELGQLMKELSKLNAEEQDYWNDFVNMEESTLCYERTKQYHLNKIATYESEIKQFSHSSLIENLFKISCQDKFGIINGARLGFGSNILWDEINAGIGYIIYLTCIIAKKYAFEFSRFDLVPMGNYSKTINKKTGVMHELTISGNSDRSIEKFNEAIVMYLECLKELNDHLTAQGKVNQKTPEGELNLKISADNINGFSIKYDPNFPDNWSQCMKYVLIVLKSYIYFVLKKEDDDYKEILEKAKILNTVNF